MSNGEEAKQVHLIPLDDINADEEFNCRGFIAGYTVVDLAKDIEKNGLMSPVTVRTLPEREANSSGKIYNLVMGFRRFLAYRSLQREVIPAFIVPNMSIVDARVHNLRENLYRKDLNIVQEAKALAHFKGIFTQAEIGKKFGQSTGWAQVRCTLLELPEEIQQEAAAGMLTQSNIRDIASLPTRELKFDAVKKIKEAKMSGEKPRKKPKRKQPHTKRVRDRTDIFEMMDYIIDLLGGKAIAESPTEIQFGLRLLAWAAGEITDSDVDKELSSVLGEDNLRNAKIRYKEMQSQKL